jgi:hypothetical protein
MLRCGQGGSCDLFILRGTGNGDVDNLAPHTIDQSASPASMTVCGAVTTKRAVWMRIMSSKYGIEWWPQHNLYSTPFKISKA